MISTCSVFDGIGIRMADYTRLIGGYNLIIFYPPIQREEIQDE